MNISHNNNINFSGIKLSDSSFGHARDVAMHLKRTGFELLGHKTCYVNNDINSKRHLFMDIRRMTQFQDRECGVVLLPWSGETYIVASPAYEQFMLPVVRHIDKDARINLLI